MIKDLQGKIIHFLLKRKSNTWEMSQKKVYAPSLYLLVEKSLRLIQQRGMGSGSIRFGNVFKIRLRLFLEDITTPKLFGSKGYTSRELPMGGSRECC